MGAVRSSVGGELLVVDPTGRITVSRAAGEEDLVRVVPRTTSIVTGFVKFGDWVGVVAVLLLTGLLLRPDPRDSKGEPV
jgi:apolipoprotein N-acyltransferase